MGVMECDRLGCEEIMCHRLILNHSMYICSDCWRELLEYKASWLGDITAAQVYERIKHFMEATRPGTWRHLNAEEVDDEFHRLTADPTAEGD